MLEAELRVTVRLRMNATDNFRLFLILATLAACLLPTVLSASQVSAAPQGFIPLFNGKDLSGWCGRKHVDPTKYASLTDGEKAERLRLANANLKKHWRVENGELINDGHGVFCTTEQDFGDCPVG